MSIFLKVEKTVCRQVVWQAVNFTGGVVPINLIHILVN